MKNQIKAADAARGLTVLVMPTVHTVMMYSSPTVHTSWLGYILMFFAEGPGAQLFMLLMGLFIALGSPKNTTTVFARSAGLFIAGYVLNFFRAFLPAFFGLFPINMLAAYHTTDGLHPLLSLLLTGDILQFAGISYGFLSFIRNTKYQVWIAALLYIIIALLAPFTWGIRSDNPLLDHFLALICANDHRAFFPLFPWLCYPLAGMLLQNYYRQTTMELFFKKLGTVGWLLLISGVVIAALLPSWWNGDFYRSSPGRTLGQTGFVLLWLYGMHLFIKGFPQGIFQDILYFCSRHITAIYCIQWIIIGWGIPIAGYQRIDMKSSLVAIVIINLLTFGITFWMSRIRVSSRKQVITN